MTDPRERREPEEIAREIHGCVQCTWHSACNTARFMIAAIRADRAAHAPDTEGSE